MSLNWNLAEIKDYKEVCFRPANLDNPDEEEGKEYLNSVTDALIWLSMFIDMGRITDKNWRDFTARVSAYETAFKSILAKRVDGELKEQYITAKDIKKHIGLWTNVVTKTPKYFSRRLGERLYDEQLDILRE